MRDFKEGRILPVDRLEALYDFLIEQGDQWTETITIFYNLCEFYGDGEPDDYTTEEFHNTAARMQITNDIRYINNSKFFEKIIICGKKGIKIANEEEAERYIRNMYSAIFRRLKRARMIEKKAKANGQITLDYHTIKSFLEERK